MTPYEIQKILDENLKALKSGRIVGHTRCACLIDYIKEVEIKKILTKNLRVIKNSRIIGKPKAVTEIFNLLNQQ